jgi:hypothetical protein
VSQDSKIPVSNKSRVNITSRERYIYKQTNSGVKKIPRQSKPPQQQGRYIPNMEFKYSQYFSRAVIVLRLDQDASLDVRSEWPWLSNNSTVPDLTGTVITPHQRFAKQSAGVCCSVSVRFAVESVSCPVQ